MDHHRTPNGRDQLRELRRVLAPFADPSWFPSLLWAAVDLLVYAALLAAVLSAIPLYLKLPASLLLGLLSARLFILGHDACHQALTPSTRANKILGRILFLPTLTPYLGWELGHNVIHHSFTNLRGKDFVWIPAATPKALAGWRTATYYHPLGLAFYYLLEIWYPRLIINRGGVSRSQPRLFLADRLLIWFLPLTIAFLAKSPLDFLLAFLLPFLVWNWLMSFVVLIHHTHPEVPWFDDKSQWSAYSNQANLCVDVQLPAWGFAILHNVLIHSPHHVNTAIPFHRLPAAQQALWSHLPSSEPRPILNVSYLRAILRDCRLFNSQSAGWEAI